MSLSILDPSTATVQESQGASRLIRGFIYAGLAMALVVGFFVARFFLWAQCFELRAFISRSASMCPAICEDERVLAGMDAFRARSPQRGEVILFERDEDPTKFIKRVIGVAGDTVARGPSNTILVNNKPLVLPPVCGDHNKYRGLAAWGPPFGTTKVPEGSVFVIGDNLDDSYDSRHFGVVPLDKVRGKALLIYFSTNASRIGCRVN
jgi:signal peptidase I